MSNPCDICASVELLPTPPAYPGCPPLPPAPGCSAVWGSIVGALGNQTDLLAYLSATYVTPAFLSSYYLSIATAQADYARLASVNNFQVDQIISNVFRIGKRSLDQGNLFCGFKDNWASANPSLAFGNTAFGTLALSAITNAQNNTAFGTLALSAITNAQNNTAVGTNALSSATTGTNNVAVGVAALPNSTTASNNTAIGSNTLSAVITAGGNTAVGFAAGFNITSGTGNTAVGLEAGPSSGTPALNNTTCIGAQAIPGKDNQVVLGNASVQETVIGGNVVLRSKVITPIGTTGNRTINATSGSVVFAAGSSSLTVTNSFAIAPTSADEGSIIIASLRGNPGATGHHVHYVSCTVDGSFTIHLTSAPSVATRCDFILFN